MADSAAQNDQRYIYGFYYPEGAGYLHIDHIAPGSQGSVALVMSCADKKVYLRKRGETIYNGQEFFDLKYGCDEVFYYRVHKLIPRLIDWTIYRPLPRSSPNYYDNSSTSTIWEFCRGGDLRALLTVYRNQNTLMGHGCNIFPLKYHIPEAFIWKVFGQLIQVLGFVHNAQPPVCHLDIFVGNVFIRPVVNNYLPDCCLGDFGRATVLEPCYWNLRDSDYDKFKATVDLMLDDHGAVIGLVKQMMTLEYLRDSDEDSISHSDRIEQLFCDLEVAHTADLMGAQETRSARAAFNNDSYSNRANYQSTIADGFSRYTPLLFDTIRQLEKRFRSMKTSDSGSGGRGSTVNIPNRLDLTYLGEEMERRAQDRLVPQITATYPAVDNDFYSHLSTIERDFSEVDIGIFALHNKAGIVASIDQKLPIGPFRIARVDPRNLRVTAISRKTYNTFEFPTADDADPDAAEGRKYERRDSEHSVADDPTQTDEILVTRRLSHGVWT